MRLAINRVSLYGRFVLTASQQEIGQLVDKALHGDTLHKLSQVPASVEELLEIIDGQLATGQFTKI